MSYRHVQQNCREHREQIMCGHPPFFSIGAPHCEFGQRLMAFTNALFTACDESVWLHARGRLHGSGACSAPSHAPHIFSPHAHCTGRNYKHSQYII